MNEPAFPHSRLGSDADGMTLRDYFAAKVMAGMWTNIELLKTLERGQESKAVAMAAYEQADAMLKARQE